MASPTRTTDQPVITFCNCERDVECIVEGKFHTEDNVELLGGNQLKCSVNHDPDVITTVKDKATIDQTFDENFLSAGSSLLLQQLGVIGEPPETIQTCNISSFFQHWNPGVVLQEIGLTGLSYYYLENDGKFIYLFLNTTSLQTLNTNSDIRNHLTQVLEPENLCSFQTLLYFLTSGSQYLLEGVRCSVTGTADTTIQILAYCRQLT